MKKEQKPGLLRPREGRTRSISEHLEKILKNLPKNPGVYQMKDKTGKVIYVGKAKNLMNRVRSYFDRTKDLTLAKRQMVEKIADIEIIICATEVEALVLETNLIKHLTPKYNILMKDDKNLAYLKITKSPVPELVKTRQKIKDGGEYFGPYVAGAEQSVRALRRIFKIRNCRMKFIKTPFVKGGSGDFAPEKNPQSRHASSTAPLQKELIQITDKAGKTPPCMDYYIGLCPAPCLLESDKLAEHEDHIDRVREFLRGNRGDIFALLESEMRAYAKSLEFEKAGEMKSTLEALKGLGERQKVRDVVEGDIDICLKYEKYDKVYIGLTQVRQNQIIGVFRHELENAEDEDVEVQFLTRQYLDANTSDVGLPDLLLLRSEIVDESFSSFLDGQHISVEYPQIGPKNDLLEFTLTQLREYAYKRQMATLQNNTLTREHMANVLERLGYEIPKKGEIVFECYDISHTDGHFTYASRVSIVNGRPDPSRYKKYKIKTLEDGQIDDFASHREVMMRRTIEGFEFDNFPHLIIIDGGKGQLSSAMSGVKEGIWRFRHSERSEESRNQDKPTRSRDDRGETPGIDQSSGTDGRIEEGVSGVDVPVIPGLSRNPELRIDETRFLHTQEGHKTDDISQGQEVSIPICSIAKREEEVFLPGEKTPILFDHGTPELMVLQKARDESHRFSITANRSARMKSMKKNILEEIPGIGPVTRKKLLKLAGSVDGLKNIDLEEIEKIVTKSQLQVLQDHNIL